MANFRPHLRSNVDHMILVLLCKETNYTYFGKDKIFNQLIEDLKDLELNYVDDEQPLKGTLCIITGDTLGSNVNSGFVESFSSNIKYWCQFCLLKSNVFYEDPCAVGPKRTKENYNLALEEMDNGDNQLNNVRGVKEDSPFNTLEHFHVCMPVCMPGLPPCLGHDLFEGIVSYIVALILKHIIRQKK